MKHRAGETVDCVVTYLEMETPPSYPVPHLPPGAVSALVAAEEPPVWYFRALYGVVGGEYEWTDQHDRSEGELAAWLGEPEVVLYTLMRAGWPHGFFMLDCSGGGICHIAYLGLVPEAMGRGLGRYLLETAVHMAWERPGVSKLTVNTNSLDHPRALPLYQKAGFTPVRRETVQRVLSRDRDLVGA